MIIMPNQLPQPSVDNPLPWKAIPHTDNFGGTVVAKSRHVVMELDSSEDAEFVAASASAFYNLVERYEYMRDLVRRLIPLAEIAEKYADADLFREARVKEIIEAIGRYNEAGKPVPQEWLDELNEKIKKESNEAEEA